MIRHGGTRFLGRGQMAAPVRDMNGRWVGTLQLQFKGPIRTPGLTRHLGALALVLLLVALGVRPLARRIARPIERLTLANRRFGDGDLAYRISVPPCPQHPDARGPEQLTELVRSWNDMAARIERLVRGQKELLANVSHELRSPLARIRLALALLPEDDPATQIRVKEVETDLGELDRLIDDVLSTARLEASGLPLRLERVNVSKLVAQLAERAEHAASGPAGKSACLTVKLEGTPELVADGALVKRAVWNLLENAAKYGAPPVRLLARTLPERDGLPERVQLVVEDEGHGIPAAEREAVFSAFHRLDKARTREMGEVGGFGLGLTFARRVAEVHGGSLHCEPLREGGPTEGCRMILELPANPPA
jgi:signal transduction histidine kinase